MECVKQDIRLIFLLLEKVLSKEHGAFTLFMGDLRDALFIPSRADLDFVKQMLQAGGLKDNQINQGQI
jgi:hypothetical protein